MALLYNFTHSKMYVNGMNGVNPCVLMNAKCIAGCRCSHHPIILYNSSGNKLGDNA